MKPRILLIGGGNFSSGQEECMEVVHCCEEENDGSYGLGWGTSRRKRIGKEDERRRIPLSRLLFHQFVGENYSILPRGVAVNLSLSMIHSRSQIRMEVQMLHQRLPDHISKYRNSHFNGAKQVYLDNIETRKMPRRAMTMLLEVEKESTSLDENPHYEQKVNYFPFFFPPIRSNAFCSIFEIQRPLSLNSSDSIHFHKQCNSIRASSEWGYIGWHRAAASYILLN